MFFLIKCNFCIKYLKKVPLHFKQNLVNSKLVFISQKTNRRHKTVSQLSIAISIIVDAVAVTINLHEFVIIIKANTVIIIIIANNRSQWKLVFLDKQIYLKVNKTLTTGNKLCGRKIWSSLAPIMNNKNVIVFFLFQIFLLKTNKIRSYLQTITGYVQRTITSIDFFKHFFLSMNYKNKIYLIYF